ncbi:MAG: DUF4345 family protein [Pseudomonadota bacterium]
MPLILKILVCLIGAFFLLIGAVGMLQPLQLASSFGFELPTPESMGQMRAMIGAHYFAMGAVCLFAGLRNHPALLLPIGIIEGTMIVARLIGAVHGEFTGAIVGPTMIEIFASSVLLFAATRTKAP